MMYLLTKVQRFDVTERYMVPQRTFKDMTFNSKEKSMNSKVILIRLNLEQSLQ